MTTTTGLINQATTDPINRATTTGPMNRATEILNNSDTSTLEGKYLTFILNHEEYGLEILKVREIIGLMDITPVPQTPTYMKGIINLRGKVIPVVDQRLKFGMPGAEYTKETCIIVVDIDNRLMGILVDTVSEVLDIAAKDIEPAPSLGSSIKTDFILGMGKIKGKVKILLNIDKVLSLEEMAMIHG